MLRWCPLPDCPTVIQVNPMLKLDYKQNCQCTCGHQFCFNCSEECHDPLPCNLISKWKEIDYENILRFAWNTKNCPKCGVLVENVGDSNRMVRDCLLLLLFSYYYSFRVTDFNFRNVTFVSFNFVGRAVVNGIMKKCTMIVLMVLDSRMMIRHMRKGKFDCKINFDNLIHFISIL